MMAEPTRIKRRKVQDRVTINVGGTLLTTSRSTLTRYSSYFESCFSDEWNSGDDDNNEPVFVDHDPVAFQTLMGFMRHGFINASEITHVVLVQADFLGVEALLREVKSIAYRNVHQDNGNVLLEEITDDEACRKFDEMYDGITGAIKKGILPKNIKPLIKKEYAQLVINDVGIKVEIEDEVEGWLQNIRLANRSLYSLFSYVDAPAHLVSPERNRFNVNGANLERIDDCPTFLDALNWLHKNGFTTIERDRDYIGGDYEDQIFDNRWFSRTVPKKEDNDSNDSNLILFDNDGDEPIVGKKKKFAAFISGRGRDAVIADTGRTTQMIVVEESSGGDRPESKITKAIEAPREEALVWLDQNGYKQEENLLSDVFLRILRKAQHLESFGEDGSPISVLVRSRPLDN